MSLVCQICLDGVESDQENELLVKFCGGSCDAQVCRQCLGRHIKVTLIDYYPGILPRIRCPVCLCPMNVSLWQDRIPEKLRSPLVGKYTTLCRQACAVTPLCCEDSNYTHLPDINLESKPSTPLELESSALAEFKALCKQFCCHKQSPRAVLDFALKTFGEKSTAILVNELALPRIEDPERRATLLLSFMHFRPNTKTRCCAVSFCFNCKRGGHHNSCAEELDESKDLVRCRNCRALLLKVEGCDRVNCACGYDMTWSFELQLRSQWMKHLIPVDIFDIPLTESWINWRHQQQGIALLDGIRAKWFERSVVAARRVLKPVFVFYIWRRRYSKALSEQIESEFYWKAYFRWNPEVLKSVVDEAKDVLCISLCDE